MRAQNTVRAGGQHQVRRYIASPSAATTGYSQWNKGVFVKRMLRVNELLKRELGQLFERYICPEVDCLVTVTAVETTPDLHTATVYLSVYGDDDQQQRVMQSVRDQRAELQKLVARNVTLKYTPVLRFRLDKQAAKADNIMKILRELDLEE